MKKRLLGIAVLVIVLSTLFISALICSGKEPFNLEKFLQMLAVNLPAGCLMGAAQYGACVLLRKCVPLRADTCQIALDFLCCNAAVALAAVAFGLMTKPGYYVIMLTWNSLIWLAIELCLYHARSVEHERSVARLEKENAMYRYEALKDKINPHFLFNCLNVLASLTYEDAATANTFAKRLSAVFRYLLSHNEGTTVSVGEELEFVRAYCYLEKVRFGGCLDIRIEADAAYTERRLLPASVQMLIENAIKHNVVSDRKPLRIAVRVGREDVLVENDVCLRSNVERHGIGLSNLRQMAGMMGQQLRVEDDGKVFRVALTYIDRVTGSCNL